MSYYWVVAIRKLCLHRAFPQLVGWPQLEQGTVWGAAERGYQRQFLWKMHVCFLVGKLFLQYLGIYWWVWQDLLILKNFTADFNAISQNILFCLFFLFISICLSLSSQLLFYYFVPQSWAGKLKFLGPLNSVLIRCEGIRMAGQFPIIYKVIWMSSINCSCVFQLLFLVFYFLC